MTDPAPEWAKAASDYAAQKTWTNSNEMVQPLRDLYNKPVIGDAAFTIAPFINLVSNLAKDASTYMPGVNVPGLIADARNPLMRVAPDAATSLGANTGRFAAQASANKVHALMGGIVMLGAAQKAIAGEITGNGPDTGTSQGKAKWAALDQSGWKPNSFKVGDSWYPNRILGPLAPILDLVGNTHDNLVYNTAAQDREDAVGRATAVMHAVGQTTLDQLHWLDAGLHFLSLMKDGTERNWLDWIAHMGSDFVPQSGNLKLAERITDPTTPNVSSKEPAGQQTWELFRRQYPGSGLKPGLPRPYSGAPAALPFVGMKGGPQAPASSGSTAAPAGSGGIADQLRAKYGRP